MASIVDWAATNGANTIFTAKSGWLHTGSNWILTIKQIGAGKGTDFAWSYNMGDSGILSNALSAATVGTLRCVHSSGPGEDFSTPAVEPLNHYSIPATGEVLDNCTGLTWQASGNASGLLAWADAVTYCQNLGLNGHTWRLPTVRELATLVDENQVAPAINRTYFPNTQYGAHTNNWYWSSHNSRGSTTYAFALNFDDGFTGYNSGAATWNTFGPSWAKCVR
jgi:hypothetical protein